MLFRSAIIVVLLVFLLLALIVGDIIRLLLIQVSTRRLVLSVLVLRRHLAGTGIAVKSRLSVLVWCLPLTLSSLRWLLLRLLPLIGRSALS